MSFSVSGSLLTKRDDFKSILESVALDGTIVSKNVAIGEFTTLRTGGRADWFVEPNTHRDLAALIKVCREYDLPVTVLGLGSNFLVVDSGVPGLTIRLNNKQFASIETIGDRIRCGAGARMKKVATEAKSNCLSRMEFLEGIPGTIGGGLRMNAGAWGGEIFQIVESISYMDLGGDIFKIGVKEVDFSYRSCSLLKNNIALEATLLGQPDNIESIAERMASFSQKRWSGQPKARSAGCIFKNPECVSAGQLIDELGFKGESEGGAMVSEEHGNFIVNKGGATAEDFLKLIERIRRRAHDERGVDLTTEVQIIGRREDRG